MGNKIGDERRDGKQPRVGNSKVAAAAIAPGFARYRKKPFIHISPIFSHLYPIYLHCTAATWRTLGRRLFSPWGGCCRWSCDAAVGVKQQQQTTAPTKIQSAAERWGPKSSSFRVRSSYQGLKGVFCTSRRDPERIWRHSHTFSLPFQA